MMMSIIFLLCIHHKPNSDGTYVYQPVSCGLSTPLAIDISSGWWYTYPSEKYDFVSWDDEIPNWMENHKIHVPNQQPVNDDVNHLPISWDCDFLIHSQTVVESSKMGATEWVFLYK